MIYVNHVKTYKCLEQPIDCNHSCPDRCDIHFDYAWNRTNLYLKYLDSDPTYFLNASDKVTLNIKKVSPEKVYIVYGDNQVELTNVSNSLTLVDDDGKNVTDGKKEISTNTDDTIGEGTWVGAIPTSWDSQGTFSVVMECHGQKVLLYEGLLNKTSYKDISYLDSEYVLTSTNGTIKVTPTNSGYDISIAEGNGLVAKGDDGTPYFGSEENAKNILKDVAKIDTDDLLDYNGTPNTSSQDD